MIAFLFIRQFPHIFTTIIKTH